ncbi:MAG: hypothetical protein M1338_03530 [Patescibacteria group bacterium]|nr:hypothetical protein [Patescibacteria group bacterium]
MEITVSNDHNILMAKGLTKDNLLDIVEKVLIKQNIKHKINGDIITLLDSDTTLRFFSPPELFAEVRGSCIKFQPRHNIPNFEKLVEDLTEEIKIKQK